MRNLKATLDESDIGQIRSGQEARFTVQSYPEEIFVGTVSQIRLNPTVISNVVTYTVVVEAPNDKGVLLPGMTATIDFIVAGVQEALVVPSAALSFAASKASSRDAPESRLLLHMAGERPLPVSVETGITDGALTEITDGEIGEGDTIIIGIKKEKQDGKSNMLSKLFPKPPKGSGRGRGPGGGI